MTEISSNKYNDSFLQYHISFFTKSKNSLKLHEINFIKNFFKSVALRHEFKIIKMEFGLNSVILMINCQTTHYIPNLIKALKGGSARFLYKEFPDSKINHGSSLWDPKYLISTDGKQLDKMIQNHKGISTH